MLNQRHIETLLHIHGISPTSSEEEIRSVLISARYNADEVDSAITILRESKVDQTARVDRLHKIYRTDSGLAPKEVSALLGVDIDVSELEIRNHRSQRLTGGQNFIVLAIAITLALSSLLYAMYLHQTGPFHPSTSFSLL